LVSTEQQPNEEREVWRSERRSKEQKRKEIEEKEERNKNFFLFICKERRLLSQAQVRRFSADFARWDQ
jgi:hypothetical protein